MAYINGNEVLFSANINIGSGSGEEPEEKDEKDEFIPHIKNALIAKGGDAEGVEKYGDVAPAIYALPVGDTSLVETIDTDTAYDKSILTGAVQRGIINEIGGGYVKKHTANCKNLFDPSLFGTDVNEAGELYYPEHIYEISASITLPKGTYTLTSSVDVHISELDIGQTSNQTFTLTETTTFSLTLCNDFSGDGGEYIWIMLNEGSTALPFESYYKYEPIKVTAVESYGANLIPFPYYTDSRTVAGITYTVNADGSIQIKGTASGYSTFVLTKEINLVAEKTYSVNDKNKVVLNYTLPDGSSAWANFPFTWKSDYKFGSLYIQIATGETVNEVMYPMLNYGTTPAPYYPYSAKPIDKYNISTYLQNLDGYGYGIEGYSNTIDCDNKKFIKRVEKIVFNGTENWMLQSINSAGLANFMIYTDKQGVGDGVCSHFGKSPMAIATATTEGVHYALNNKTMYFRSFKYKTVDEWKSYLAEMNAERNPVTVVYALTNAEETDIRGYFPYYSAFTDIEIQEGGYLRFVNDLAEEVPSKITYIRRLA